MNLKRSIPLLVSCLLILSVVLYYSTIHLFPSFIHAWTQSDRYAIALRFLDNGFDLFHPATFNLQTVDGITRVDFPISEFIVAVLMKIFGASPAVFRMYTLSVSILGLVYLYLFTRKITSSEIKSWMAVLFVFFAPVYVYYQAGFIPSIPAIASVFIAYYYFFSYKENAKNRHLLLAVIFFLLAALIRFPFIIFLIAALLQQGWMLLKDRKANGREALCFAGAFVIFASYYLYNVHLGRIYGNMFLDALMPAKSLSEFREIVAEMYHHWLFQYFTLWHYLLIAIAVAANVIIFIKNRSVKPENKKYWFHLFIIGSGTFIYFLLMTRQYYAHDYYFLDSLFVPVVLFFVFLLKNIRMESLMQKAVWGFGFIAAVILFFISNQSVQTERYTTGPWDRTEITRENFIGTDHYLDSIGVPKDAKILVIDAYTTNVPLILMNRKGYTVLGTTAKNISTTLAWAKWDYVAIQDVYLVSDVISGYPHITAMLERVGGNGKVSFYKRSDKIKPKSLKQFLGIKPENTLYRSFFSTATDEKHTIATLDPGTEYGLTASVKAKDLNNENNLKVLVNADFKSNTGLKDIQLVAALSNSEGQIFYHSFALPDYFRPSAAWQKMEFQFVLPAFKTPDDELKVYLWNPAKMELEYDNWEVMVYK